MTQAPYSKTSAISNKHPYLPAFSLGLILASFLIIEAFIPLRTTVQIGADEGFELAKAVLCVNGHHLYTEVWDDEPPVYTFLVEQILKHVSPSILWPRLLTLAFALVLLSAVFIIGYRLYGLWVGAVAAALVMASPGFLELASSVMLEIPALATALAALSFLLVTAEGKWHWTELASGVVFGLALQMKLVPVIYLPLVALVIFLKPGETPLQKAPDPNPKPNLNPAPNPETQFESAKRILLSLSIFAAALSLTCVATDLLIERGAYLTHFGQTWSSHFAPPKSLEYGSAREHPFLWLVPLKNWDATVPALIGVAILLTQARSTPFSLLPLAWLTLTFLVFTNFKPWWAYYYVHTAVPLCLCAAVGIVFVSKWLKTHRKWAVFGLFIAFLVCASAWMGARLYLQVTNLRLAPQTYSSPVIAQMQRFNPFAEFLYADRLIYSWHSGIPLVPSLAVMSMKRLWSGDMTLARFIEELEKNKPGLILLPNDGREVAFRQFLQAEYQPVYIDAENRLYAHRSIARKPGY